MTKVIIIFWRWELPDTPLPCFFETSDQNGILYCIHQNAPEGEWQAYLEYIVTVNIGANFLLFLHLHDDFPAKARVNIYTFLSNLLLGRSSKMFYHPFFGGKEFIYFNPNRDTGLLWGGGGTLVKDTFYRDTKMDHSIFDDEGRIISKYYDGVWKHYHSYKRSFFELHEHLIRHFAIVDELPAQTLKDYVVFNQLFALKHSIDKIIAYNEIKSTVLAIGSNQKLILSEYEGLLQHFDQNLNTPGFVTHLNQKFTRFINLLPGTIY